MNFHKTVQQYHRNNFQNYNIIILLQKIRTARLPNIVRCTAVGEVRKTLISVSNIPPFNNFVKNIYIGSVTTGRKAVNRGTVYS